MVLPVYRYGQFLAGKRGRLIRNLWGVSRQLEILLSPPLLKEGLQGNKNG